MRRDPTTARTKQLLKRLATDLREALKTTEQHAYDCAYARWRNQVSKPYVIANVPQVPARCDCWISDAFDALAEYKRDY